MTRGARAAVVGAGPAGLMAAERLAEGGLAVTVYDQMASPARKFLLAGRGGLNLTHSEPLGDVLARYRPADGPVRAAIEAFPPQQVRAWCEGLGQPTFVGTSGRVFPVAMKASPLLRAWLRRLRDAGVTFMPRHRFLGWRDGALMIERPDAGTIAATPDVTVLALGGASWPRLGSDGTWTAALATAGVAIRALRPANCAMRVAWSAPFRTRRAGAPLKRIAVTFAGRTVRGEIVITSEGLEGGAIYALSADLREAITRDGHAMLTIDLRPDMAQPDLAAHIARRRPKESLSTALRKNAKLSAAAIDLMQEAGVNAAAVPETLRPGELPPADLAAFIKAVPVEIVGIAGLERAISTAGGVSLDGIECNFMLRTRPGVFVAGEMLDWEAPTGGYLLQASFATGFAAAEGAIAWLANNELAIGKNRSQAR